MSKDDCQLRKSNGCNQCHTKQFCLPVALASEDVAKLDAIVLKDHIMEKGEHVFRNKSTFTAFYAIRYGQIKTYRLTDDSEEQITGFYFPGEIFGLDGISQTRFMSSAKALESTSICEINYSSFQELMVEIPDLQKHFLQLMSHEIISHQELITVRNKKTAEQRIANFLLNISTRNAKRHRSATDFRLAMSRKDIGNYLGLTVETVSRTLTRLTRAGYIEIDKKEIRIKDIDRLMETADMESAKSFVISPL